MQENFEPEARVLAAFPRLKINVIRQHDITLSERDQNAIFDILTWTTAPSFFKPGRTAWYRLQDPFETETGVRVQAAKLKGVGGWNPEKQSGASGIRGQNPEGLVQPSNTEYAADVRRPHFGIADDGEFCIAYSERSPFGAITRKRADFEYLNAAHLLQSDIPAIIPYCLVDYPELEDFYSEPLSAVVSLSPALEPTRLEYFVLGGSHLTEQELEETKAIGRYFAHPNDHDPSIDAIRVGIGQEIGSLMRKFSAAGMFRHSCYWDNFMYDPVKNRLFLTDLDSTQFLCDIPNRTRGLQQARDLAGALFRLADSLYRDFVIRSRSFKSLRSNDPFAAVLAGYFQIPLAEAKQMSQPIWRYFGTHWFLIDKMAEEMSTMPFEMRKSYQVERNFFYCLAIHVFSDVYRRKYQELGLEPIPEIADLDDRTARFLGEHFHLLELMLERDGSLGV